MPKPSLLFGERVLLETRRHVFALLVPVSLVGALALAAVKGCHSAVLLHLDGRCLPLSLPFVAFGALPLISDWVACRLIVTNQRLVLIQAPIWHTTHSVQLREVVNVSIEQGVWGRLLDFGRVAVETPAAEAGSMVFAMAPNPKRLADLILRAALRSRT